ncbi:hypothetical protein LC612_37820, partial [Nostoc sp. CHAB 5834]|nr:hypothetical protein [Nostoc sp. CHAB 5834]
LRWLTKSKRGLPHSNQAALAVAELCQVNLPLRKHSTVWLPCSECSSAGLLDTCTMANFQFND